MGEFWKTVRNTKKAQVLENSTNLIPDPKAWPDHFMSEENNTAPVVLKILLNEAGLNPQKVEYPLNEQDYELCSPISQEEIEKAIKSDKGGFTPGPDGIPATV